MKYTEFHPEIKSEKLSDLISVRPAVMKDVNQIVGIDLEREGCGSVEATTLRFGKEIKAPNENLLLLVAVKNTEILGFCRTFHSSLIEESRMQYSSPVGFYNMGITVKTEYRRQNIGKLLSKIRLEWLRKKNVTRVYSGVSSLNKASLWFHKKLGFYEIKEVEGFLHVKFDCGKGKLFAKEF